MRFAHFILDGKECFGTAVGDSILPFSALPDSSPCSSFTLDRLLQDGNALERLRKEDLLASNEVADSLVGEDEVEFLGCVPRPSKIICVGLNYRSHALETGMPIPEVPVIFSKFSDTVSGHRQLIPVPPNATQIDYEGELGLMIGKETFCAGRDEALARVFGFFPANDFSARDLQLRTSQWLIGKTPDAFCPVGPYLVTADEAGDPDSLRIQTHVNGELRQDSSTSDMIFSCSSIVSYISQYVRMRPGDIILTGTPSGVILGKPSSQRNWLKKGDEISVTIERLGTLTNRLA